MNVPEFLPVEQFVIDWVAKFDSEIPYLGGLRDLEIYEVPDGCLIDITDHAGYEKVNVIYNDHL